MGVRILHDLHERKAVLYDSVTDTAFGPVFDDFHGHVSAMGGAECFVDWYEHVRTEEAEPIRHWPRSQTHSESSTYYLPHDVRYLTTDQLRAVYAEWLDRIDTKGQGELEECPLCKGYGSWETARIHEGAFRP